MKSLLTLTAFVSFSTAFAAPLRWELICHDPQSVDEGYVVNLYSAGPSAAGIRIVRADLFAVNFAGALPLETMSCSPAGDVAADDLSTQNCVRPGTNNALYRVSHFTGGLAGYDTVSVYKALNGENVKIAELLCSHVR